MKRLITLLISAIMLLAFCVSVSAESDPLSVKYVPRTTRGTLFYLDVSCDASVSAAIFELRFDPDRLEYRSVNSDDDHASVMANAGGGTVKIAYSNRDAAKGMLFRLAFKALSAGEADFMLSLSQAVDGDLHYLTDVPVCKLTVKLGKEDVAAGSTSISEKSAKSSEKSKKTYSGSKSSLTTEDDTPDDEATGKKSGGIFRDLSGAGSMTYLVLGGAIVILAGLLVGAGIIVGRKMKKKPSVDEEIPDENDPEEMTEDTVPEIPQPTVEEIFKDIE